MTHEACQHLLTPVRSIIAAKIAEAFCFQDVVVTLYTETFLWSLSLDLCNSCNGPLLQAWPTSCFPCYTKRRPIDLFYILVLLWNWGNFLQSALLAFFWWLHIGSETTQFHSLLCHMQSCRSPLVDCKNILPLPLCYGPRSGEQRTQKVRSYLLRTQNSKVLPLEPGVGQNKAMHATPTARNFFLAIFYHLSPFTGFFFSLFFSKTSPKFFPCWLC